MSGRSADMSSRDIENAYLGIGRRVVTEAVQQVVNALAIGSIYALIALGVAMVFSILRLINFAHGELVTVGRLHDGSFSRARCRGR